MWNLEPKRLAKISAISFEGPRPEDMQRTIELLKILEVYSVIETEDLNHRMAIMAKEISLAKNMSEAVAHKLVGKIGSNRLDLHRKGADIDELCVVSRNIEETDYSTPELTEYRSIEEAFVPVIKMNFDGIEIDLLFDRLAHNEIPDDFDLRDDNLLNNLDPWSVRSLNGCCVTDEILSLVPDIENFRLALRSIKLWAKKHGIYSHLLGYFGGVTWAILVAHTCQLYPNATVSTLLQKFFLIFSRWEWPRPVFLKHQNNVYLSLPEWDPRINALGRSHLMPIITPAFPQQNSTFNVSESTKKVILMEFNRGMTTLDEIMSGKASWDRLFEAPSFFYSYCHFIVLLISSQAADDHLKWCGVVESKIPFLIGDLERNQHISLAHVNPKCFDYKRGSDCNISFSPNSNGNEDEKSLNAAGFAPGQQTLSSSPCSMLFIGLEFQSTDNLNEDLIESIWDFTEIVTQHGFDIKMLKEGMSIEARYINCKVLPQYLDMNSELKSMFYNTDSTNNTITAKPKILLSEMQQNDAHSSGSSGKRLMEENSNASSDAGGGTTTTTTPTLQQQTPPIYNIGANKPKVELISHIRLD